MSFSINDFISPPKRFRPLVRWWWPGLAVTKDEILNEVKLLDEAGFGGFEIQPFLIGGADGATPEKVHRMAPNPYFFEILKISLKESKARNLIVDLTLGSSWPPGGTQISKKDSLKTLMMGTKIIKGPQKVNIKPPKYQLNAYYKYEFACKGITGAVYDDFSKYINDFKLVAITAVKPIKKSENLNFVFPKATELDFKTALDLSNKLDDQGNLDWDVPEGDWQIFAFYGGPTGMTPMKDAKSNVEDTSLVVDILSKEATETMLRGLLGFDNNNIESIKEYFGNTFRALFTDSQEIADEWFWTESFFAEFKKRRGYDIKPYLPVCFVPNRDNQFLEVFFQNEKPCFEFKTNEVGNRIRFDWLKTLSEIWAENYIKFISEWGTNYANGLKHRIQTYGMPVDLIKTFSAADIPETESLFSGSLDFFKIAGSVGALYKKPIVSSETFSWNSKDLQTNPIKWKVACDRGFVSGVNQHIFHGWSYQTDPNKYPGRYPWVGHGFSENLNKNSWYWHLYPKLNEYSTRIQYILRISSQICNIAIFNDCWNYSYKWLTNEDNEEGYLPGYDAGKIKGPIPWFMRRIKGHLDKKVSILQNVGHNLTDNGYSYIHINEDSLMNGKIQNGMLRIGHVDLKAIIFPNIDSLSLQIMEKLELMADAGIKIIFYGKTPERQSGFRNFKQNDEIIKEILSNNLKDGFSELKKNENIAQFLKSKYIKPYLEFDAPQHKLSYIYKKSGDLYFIFIRSGDFNPNHIQISFNFLSKNIYLLDSWKGKISEFHNIRRLGLKMETELHFHPYESKLFIFTNKDLNKSILSLLPLSETIWNFEEVERIKLTEWSLSVVKRKINGTIEEFNIKIDKLVDWRNNKLLKYCSGPGIYATDLILTEENIKSNKIILDLGKVQDIAEISINDEILEEVFIPPYILDITKCVKIGLNKIKIVITGSIQNRLIGYAQEENSEWNVYKKRKLMPIGLIGPVFIRIMNVE